ncbi:conserved unknown protein [Ectocarpus siliculosus]|uniref:Sugar phosphate transporter domain-containing protein n=1 Tax=Ectocarpus siliculosus TaxID=2880 RepID=D8LC95_ECTSI|nr:conserved unknown protein [Ectocarpus siliculosus]|eukprot:CBN78131.1 conserved unknown protein [Ectocarpus siliculosus]
MMAKALLIIGTLCSFASVGAFVPTCPRIASPSACARPSSAGIMSRASALADNRVRMQQELPTTPAGGRAARTELFSTPAASGDKDAAPSPASAVEKEAKASPSMVKVTAYFGLWYLFNIGYNIYNKRVLNILPMPWLMASAQLGIGLLYVFPLWLTKLRKAPKLADGALGPLSQLAALHTVAHVTAVLSLGAGAVSFTHIVKAAEPVFTAGFSAALLGQTFAAPVYLSLLPIIAGVSLASLKELSFSWVAFGNAMGSNTASALRGILGKKQMGKPVGENMSPANLYAVLTVLAFCFLSPVALLVEGRKAKPAWDAAIAAGATAKGLSSTILLSGLFYYLYNEVAFLALDSVNPVTHAVGNTIKRVVIIVAACIAFRTPMTPLSIAGSTIAVAGTLLYSLVKAHYEKKK